MPHKAKDVTKDFFQSPEFTAVAVAVVAMAEERPVGTGSIQSDAMLILTGVTAAYCGALAKQIVNEDGAERMAKMLADYFRETLEDFAE